RRRISFSSAHSNHSSTASLIIASACSGVSPWLTMPSSGQFAIYQPSSPGSIAAVSLGSFTPRSLPYPAICANSRHPGNSISILDFGLRLQGFGSIGRQPVAFGRSGTYLQVCVPCGLPNCILIRNAQPHSEHLTEVRGKLPRTTGQRPVLPRGKLL